MSSPAKKPGHPTERPARTDFFFFASMLLAIAILVAYITHFSQPEFNSDDATNSLQAQAMYEQGTLYPPSWKVANGDMIFPSAAALIAPMLAWMPNGFLANAIAATILSLALLAALGYFLRGADISWPATALVVMTLALGFSGAFVLMTYLETAYVWWPLAFFILVGLIVSDDARESRKVLLLMIFIASLAISLKNPSRVAVMVLLPALVFSRALAMFGKKQPSIESSLRSPVSRRALSRELAMLLGLAVAFITIKILIHTGRIDNSAGLLPYLHVTDANGFWNHLKLFCTGWFDYLGAYLEGHADQKYEPFMRVFRTAIVAALTLNLFIELWQWKKNIDPARRALIAAFLAVFLPTLTMYLLFDPLAQNHLSTRYFTVPYLILLALAGWRINDMLRNHATPMSWAMIVFCIISLASGIQRMIPLGDSLLQSRYQLLAAVLQKEGLKYGYGSWWNASSTTILSDSKVRVLPVLLTPSEIKPYLNWIDTNQFYRKHETDSSFLIIADDEQLPEQRDVIQEKLGQAQREIVAGDARILVYDRDIANSFICKSGAMNTPLPDAEFKRVKILAVDMRVPALADGRRRIRVRIRNESVVGVSSEGSYPTNVGIHLLDKNGGMVDYDFVHASLGCPSFAPGEERAILLTLPKIPQGDYQLELDLVQEGYAWFAKKGGETKRVDIPAQP